MAFNIRDTRIVKGMLARGDRQHDIAAYFGVNGGRVAEVATGDCDYPNVEPAVPEILPPPGPYVTKYALNSVIETLDDALAAIEIAEETQEIKDVKAALELAKETIKAKIASLEPV